MLQEHSVPVVWTLAVGPIGIQNSMPALLVPIPVAVAIVNIFNFLIPPSFLIFFYLKNSYIYLNLFF
jgi:hypothetical protein